METAELYKDLKQHGFQIQDMQLQDANHITRLMLSVALTYVWLWTLGTNAIALALKISALCQSIRQ